MSGKDPSQTVKITPKQTKSPSKLDKLEASVTGSILEYCAVFAYKYSWPILIVSIITAALCLQYTANNLFFDSDRANLIKRSSHLQASQDAYIREFPNAEDIVVTVEDATAQERKVFVDSLSARLRGEPDTFDYVFEKIDVAFLGRYAIQYLDKDTLEGISKVLERNLSYLKPLSKAYNLVQLFGNADIYSIEGYSDDTLEGLTPMIVSFVDLLNESMETRGRYQYYSPWYSSVMEGTDADEDVAESFVAPDLKPVYNTLSNGRIYLVLVRPKYHENEDKSVAIQRAVLRIRQIIDDLELSHSKVLVGLTGELVLDTDEAIASQQDSLRSSLWSLLLIAGIFAWAFNEIYRPIMTVFTLMIGVCWTMGFTTLAVGHLNLLTVTFATILIGLGIDFGIHFIYRYDEERLKGFDSLQAMRHTLAGAGKENLTGAVSTAIAFWVLKFTDFTGIGELGIIAGTGIILCFVAMAVVLPAFLFLQERYSKQQHFSNKGQYAALAVVEKFLLKNSALVVIVCVIFTGYCLWESRKVIYDYNLLNLQSKGIESVTTEMHLMNSSQHSLLFGISLCDNVAEAGKLTEKYRKLPTVANVESVASIIPQDYAGKQKYLKKIVKMAAEIPNPTAIPPRDFAANTASQMKQMGETIRKYQPMLHDVLSDLKNSPKENIRNDAKNLENSINKLFNTMQGMGPGPIEDGLSAFEYDFFSDFHDTISFLKSQVDGPCLTVRDIPYNLRIREVGTTDKIQVRVFPKENIWERPAQERFVKSILEVDPSAVGMPVVMYYDTQELRTANERAGIYALIAIWFLIFLHFRRVKVSLLALFPKVIGIIWMVGIMGVCGINFNSANFLALPLILGIGLVFGIHVVHRILECQEVGIFNCSTGPSIALAAITTMIGFGTLMLGDHRGVSSLGFIMTAGVGANLLSSIIFLPSLMELMNKKAVGFSVKSDK